MTNKEIIDNNEIIAKIDSLVSTRNDEDMLLSTTRLYRAMLHTDTQFRTDCIRVQGTLPIGTGIGSYSLPKCQMRLDKCYIYLTFWLDYKQKHIHPNKIEIKEVTGDICILYDNDIIHLPSLDSAVNLATELDFEILKF